MFFQQGKADIQGYPVNPGGPCGCLLEIVPALPDLKADLLVIVLKVFLGIRVGPAQFNNDACVGQDESRIEVAAQEMPGGDYPEARSAHW